MSGLGGCASFLAISIWWLVDWILILQGKLPDGNSIGTVNDL